jgi:ABC-type antimicrobial peptide transport system permease subunit
MTLWQDVRYAGRALVKARGLAMGCLGAFLTAQWFSRLLFGVKATDPQVFLVGVLTLTIFGMGANYLPARRAGKIDPNRALRSE